MSSLTAHMHSYQSLKDVGGAPISCILLQSYIGKFKAVTKAKLQPFWAYDLKALSYGLV